MTHSSLLCPRLIEPFRPAASSSWRGFEFRTDRKPGSQFVDAGLKGMIGLQRHGRGVASDRKRGNEGDVPMAPPTLRPSGDAMGRWRAPVSRRTRPAAQARQRRPSGFRRHWPTGHQPMERALRRPALGW